jgi:predicted aspartyl protease
MPRSGGRMRGLRRSTVVTSLLFLALNSNPALAGAACGPLNLMTTMELRPNAGVPLVTALIGDKPVGLLVDTGGAFSGLTKRAIQELNLQTGEYLNRDGSITVLKDVRGQTAALQTRLPSITLGRIRQENVWFMVLPGEETGGPEIEEFGGILGSEMLRNVDVDFDFAANKLNLFSPDHCAGNVVYWTSAQSTPVAIVPFTLNSSGHIMFRAQLDGRRVNTMLDTGFSNTTLNLDVARRVFRVDLNAPDVEKIGELTGGYTADRYRRRFKTLELEGITINDPVINMLPDMMGGVNPGAPRTGSLIRDERSGLPDLILGMNLLSEMHVYIAYRERKLYITAANPSAAAAPQ